MPNVCAAPKNTVLLDKMGFEYGPNDMGVRAGLFIVFVVVDARITAKHHVTEEVSFSSWCFGWAALLYCGTLSAFHIISYNYLAYMYQ